MQKELESWNLIFEKNDKNVKIHTTLQLRFLALLIQ